MSHELSREAVSSIPLLSAEMKATADALRAVRAQLTRLIAEGRLPEGTWPDVSTVQLLGLDVAEALERLADASPDRTVNRKRGPYDPDERR